ncbi:MAG: hypothetical protein P1R58_09315 [bacterium]|nr:hypothetical protein [bacterium]
MKKYIILLLSLLIIAPAVGARPRKKKTGVVEDLVYTDTKYDFTMKFNEDWKYSLRNAGDNFRFILVKKNYAIPPAYSEVPQYTMIPRIAVWIDTTSNTPFEFLDSLISPDFKSDQKNELRKEFEILINDISQKGDIREKLITRQKRAQNVNGKKAMAWVGKVGYRKEIVKSISDNAVITEPGDYGGYILAIKNGDNICVIHMICEWNYFDTNMSQLGEMINSIDWKDAK